MFKYIWLSILPHFKRTVTFIKSSGRTTLNSVWICLSLMPTFALRGFIPLPFQCLVSELLQASPFFYFPIMTQIPFVLAKPRERQEKKLIFNQSPSSAAIGRQIQHHLSLVFSLQSKEGRRAESLFLIPIMPDSFPGTYWGKCSTPHQGPEPFSSTWDRFELTCQRLTYSLQLNLKGKKKTNKTQVVDYFLHACWALRVFSAGFVYLSTI